MWLFRREKHSPRQAATIISTVTAWAATPATRRASSARGRRSWRRTRAGAGWIVRSEAFCFVKSGFSPEKLCNMWSLPQALTVVCPVCREPLTYDVDQLLSAPAPQLPEVKTTSTGSVRTSFQNRKRQQTCALRWTRQPSVQASGRSGVSSRSCWRGRGPKVESSTRRWSPTVSSSTSTRWEEVAVLLDGSFPSLILVLLDSSDCCWKWKPGCRRALRPHRTRAGLVPLQRQSGPQAPQERRQGQATVPERPPHHREPEQAASGPIGGGQSSGEPRPASASRCWVVSVQAGRGSFCRATGVSSNVVSRRSASVSRRCCRRPPWKEERLSAARGQQRGPRASPPLGRKRFQKQRRTQQRRRGAPPGTQQGLPAQSGGQGAGKRGGAMTTSHSRAYEQVCVFLHHQINSAKALHYKWHYCCPLPSPT